MAYTPNTLKTMGMHGLMVASAGARDVDSCRVWTYLTADALATTRAINYFTDALYRNMQVGDIVHIVIRATPGSVPTAAAHCLVMAVAATGADLTDGTAIAVTNT